MNGDSEDNRGDEELYYIGDTARFFGISPDLVRYYEKTGLLQPTSVGGNGYRRYSFEDLIKLNYVRVLRSLDFGLDDIARFIEASDLAGQESMLGGRLKEVEAELARLERIRDELRGYRRCIKGIAPCLGKLEILESPAFVLCYGDAEKDPFMTEAHDRLGACDLARGGTYSLLVGKESFSSGINTTPFLPLCSALWLGGSSAAVPEGCELMLPMTCVHTVFESKVKVTEEDVLALAQAVKAQNLAIKGDALFQYLAFEQKEGVFVDYIEAWIPINHNRNIDS